MPKTIIISNRLPAGIQKNEGRLKLIQNAGGLATGLSSVFSEKNSLWIGWSGIYPEDEKEEALITSKMKTQRMIPVYFTKDEINKFYEGFSNDTLWPLFHYFTNLTSFSDTNWDTYVDVNKKFCEAVLKIAKQGDTVWIHDYHLFLLPNLLRAQLTDISIGFFLHVPFPSFEIFRLLPWREEILNGVLGANLIGFHTYDDTRHFLSSTNRLLGKANDNGYIEVDARLVKVDAFPMGIDYEKFESMAVSGKIKKNIEDIHHRIGEMKLILSVDRLDFSKGIPEKLKAYEIFLQKYPEYHEKCCLVLIVVPSRMEVENYKNLKSQIEMEVGRINGKFGKLPWNPVYYVFNSIPNDYLTALYKISDIAMVTPLRDGMNLVAKEYIASQTQKTGVLILSEMAGAAKELSDAILVNPYNYNLVAESIKIAMEMPEEEQKMRNSVMQTRLKRNNVHKWAATFIAKLNEVSEKQLTSVSNTALKITKYKQLATSLKKHLRRVIFIDYDGTLVGYKDSPEMARPDPELMSILEHLTKNKKNKVVIITGRNRLNIGEWLKPFKNINIIAEHGVWQKESGKDWECNINIDGEWKQEILPVFQNYVDRTPGTFVEEKEYSLVFHYRKADPDFGQIRARELISNLEYLIRNKDLQVLEGKKVIELKTASINKGIAAVNLLKKAAYDLVVAIGDDYTDEDMFKLLPEDAFTIKVGEETTKAKYYVHSFKEVRLLLKSLISSTALLRSEV